MFLIIKKTVYEKKKHNIIMFLIVSKGTPQNLKKQKPSETLKISCRMAWYLLCRTVFAKAAVPT